MQILTSLQFVGGCGLRTWKLCSITCKRPVRSVCMHLCRRSQKREFYLQVKCTANYWMGSSAPSFSDGVYSAILSTLFLTVLWSLLEVGWRCNPTSECLILGVSALLWGCHRATATFGKTHRHPFCCNYARRRSYRWKA